MPKISALPPMTTADAADEAPIVDSSASTTKKWTLTLLKTYLQSLTSWITTAMVGDAEITSEKLKATVAFLAHLGSAQNTTNGTSKVNLNSESYDEGSDFDNATNYRFTAPVNGVYHFDAGIRTGNAAAIRLIAVLYKNGAIVREGVSQAADTFTSSVVSTDIKLAANDYIELYVTSNGTNGMTITASGDIVTWMNGHLVGEY